MHFKINKEEEEEVQSNNVIYLSSTEKSVSHNIIAFKLNCIRIPETIMVGGGLLALFIYVGSAKKQK